MTVEVSCVEYCFKNLLCIPFNLFMSHHTSKRFKNLLGRVRHSLFFHGVNFLAKQYSSNIFNIRQFSMYPSRLYNIATPFFKWPSWMLLMNSGAPIQNSIFLSAIYMTATFSRFFQLVSEKNFLTRTEFCSLKYIAHIFK